MSFCRLCGAGFQFVGEHKPGCEAVTPKPPAAPELPEPWRVGHRIPEHVYIGDRPLVTMPTAELAALVVEAVNARLARG